MRKLYLIDDNISNKNKFKINKIMKLTVVKKNGEEISKEIGSQVGIQTLNLLFNATDGNEILCIVFNNSVWIKIIDKKRKNSSGYTGDLIDIVSYLGDIIIKKAIKKYKPKSYSELLSIDKKGLDYLDYMNYADDFVDFCIANKIKTYPLFDIWSEKVFNYIENELIKLLN